MTSRDLQNIAVCHSKRKLWSRSAAEIDIHVRYQLAEIILQTLALFSYIRSLGLDNKKNAGT